MSTNRELQLESCDATAGWSALINKIYGLSLNTTGQTEGTGCLSFGLTGFSSGYGNGNGKLGKLFASKDLTDYDYLQYKFYVNSTATLSGLGDIYLYAIQNSGTITNNYFKWTTNANSLSTGWNTIKNYFINADISGTPQLSAMQELVLEISKSNNVDATTGNISLDDIRVVRKEENTYDVKLDDQGFLLKQGSYNMTDLSYTVDRFSTGDLTYSSLNLWQYYVQSDWSGGMFHNNIINGNEFFRGYNLDLSDPFKVGTPDGLSALYDGGHSGAIAHLLCYNNSDYFSVIPETGLSAFVKHLDGNYSAIIDLTLATSSGLTDLFTWRNNVWIADLSTNLRFSAAGGWSTVNQSAVYFQEFDNDLYFSTIDGKMMSFDGTTWTTEFTNQNRYIHRMESWNNKLYFLESSPDYSNQENVYLCSYDGTNKLELYKWNYSFCNSTMKLFNNKLHFIINSNIYSYDGTNIIKELETSSIDNKQLVFNEPGYKRKDTHWYELGRHGAVVSNNELILNASYNYSNYTFDVIKKSETGEWYPSYQTDNQVFSVGISHDNYDLIGDNYTKLLFNHGDNNSHINQNSILESSWIDMDFFSIDKLFYSILIYFDNGYEFSNVRVYYKIDNDADWIYLNTTEYTNLKYLEAKLPFGIYGKKIKYKIEINGTKGGQKFVITDIAIKYLLMPDTKKKWTMGVLMANEMILDDKTREVKTGKELRQYLWNSRMKKKSLVFQDIDGVEHNVIINDLQFEGPFIDKGREGQGTGPEYHAFLELIEI